MSYFQLYKRYPAMRLIIIKNLQMKNAQYPQRTELGAQNKTRPGYYIIK